MIIYRNLLKPEELALIKSIFPNEPLKPFDSYNKGEIKDSKILFLFNISDSFKDNEVAKDKYNNIIMKTWEPKEVYKHPPYSLDLLHNAEKFLNLDVYKSYWDKVENIEYEVINFKDITDKVRESKEWAIDIETRGFNFKRDKILITGISNGEDNYIIVHNNQDDEDMTAFKEFLESKEHIFIWQNGKFDCKFFRSQTGIKARVDEDTMLQSYVLDERGGDDDDKISGTKNSIHGLEFLSMDILNVESYKGKIDFETISDMNNALHKYNAQDIMYTYWVWKFQKKKIEEDQDLEKLYRNHLIPASEFLLRIEQNGIRVNADYLKELDVSLGKEVAEYSSRLKDAANEFGFDPIEYMLEGYAQKAPKEFNPGSPKQLGYLIFNKIGLPRHKGRDSTDMDAISYWLFDKLQFPGKDIEDVDDDELAAWAGGDSVKKFLLNLVMHRKAKKLHSTYVEAIAEKMDPQTHRIHASYLLHGTVTGRLASKKPNMQNIPRRKDIKNIFKADDGNVLVTVDYSQAELRVLACLSNDRNMIEAYRKGLDLHDENSKKVFGPNFTKEQRVIVKSFVFGAAYGRGAESIAMDLKIPVIEAKKLHTQLFMGMPEAAKYIAQTRSACLSEPQSTIFGRKRRFGLITRKNLNSCENESINFPIQSTASDITLTAGMEFQKYLDNNGHNDVRIVNIVHDDVLFETPEHKAKELAKVLIDIMAEVPTRYFGNTIPWEADPEVCGFGWGDKKKLEL